MPKISKGPKTAAMADAVFMEIPTDGQWIHNKEIVNRTGLKKHQVFTAIAYIRDVYPDLDKALLSGYKGYTFSLEPGEVGDFRAMRIKHAATSIDRTYKSVAPYLKQVEDPRASWLEVQFRHVVESLEALA